MERGAELIGMCLVSHVTLYVFQLPRSLNVSNIFLSFFDTDPYLTNLPINKTTHSLHQASQSNTKMSAPNVNKPNEGLVGQAVNSVKVCIVPTKLQRDQSKNNSLTQSATERSKLRL